MSPESLTKTQKVFTMLGALLGLLLAALDQTIVATAGPRIQRDLAIEAGIYVWITTAYLVASTVLVPIYGKLSDLYGRKRILLVAIGVFLAGSLLCGVSRSATQLIAFRAVQGIGSAGLFTSAFAVVADLFPPAERGKWQGMFGAAWGVSSVVGPLTGGFITDHLGWHWAFFINLPIGLVAVGFIITRMPPLRRDQGVRPRLDIAGAIALTAATLPLLLALSLGHAEGVPAASGWPWRSWQIASLFALSVVSAIVFVLIERRARSPILDLALFRNRAFAIGSLGAFIVGGAFLGAIVFLPLFMVNVVGVSATNAGLTTTPLTLGIVAANILAGQLVSRLGAYKGLLVGSLVILVGAFAMLAATLEPGATQGGITLKMIVLGIGLGPSIPLFTLAIQNAVPPRQIGVATASATFARQLGSTIGLAIVGTVFATSLSSILQVNVGEATRDAPAEIRAQLEARPGTSDGEAPSQVLFDANAIKHRLDERVPEGEARERAYATVDRVDRAFKDAYTDAIVNVYLLSFVIGMVGLLVTAFLPRVPLRRAGERPAAAE